MRMLNELADDGHDDVPYDGPTDSPDSPITACPPTKGPPNPPIPSTSRGLMCAG